MNIAELIAERLAAGLQHPGDMKEGQPPMPIRLPMFRTVGMPPEVHTQVQLTAKLIAEAIVHLIQTDGESEIVSKTELEELRKAKK